MHAIGHIELQDELKAAELFNKSYQLYIKEPFNVMIDLLYFWIHRKKNPNPKCDHDL